VTDETPETPAPEPVGITLAQLWAANYEAVLPFLIGNTLSKADKQQYRLKAADVALGLASMEARRFA
jgi:hypothetical protein